MSTLSVRIHFAAGHRILGLTGAGAKCRNPHGHTFWATFTFEQSDEWPPTIEFGTVKATLRSRISDRYDHCFFVDKHDRDMHDFLVADDCKHYAFDGPPTTERIAEQLAREAMLLNQSSTLVSVVVEEGPENPVTWTAT